MLGYLKKTITPSHQLAQKIRLGHKSALSLIPYLNLNSDYSVDQYNSYKMPLIFHAVSSRFSSEYSEDILRSIIREGANVNQYSKFYIDISGFPREGFPLTAAIEACRPELCEVLLEGGADIKGDFNFFRFIDEVLYRSSFKRFDRKDKIAKVVELMLKMGADPNCSAPKNYIHNYGTTPLDYCKYCASLTENEILPLTNKLIEQYKIAADLIERAGGKSGNGVVVSTKRINDEVTQVDFARTIGVRYSKKLSNK